MSLLHVRLSNEPQTAAPVESMHFGKSTGSTRSYRIEFEGFEGDAYRVAVAVKKPFFFSSRFFEKEVLDQTTNQRKTIWININSFKKRFSHAGEHGNNARWFLVKNIPEALRQGVCNAFHYGESDADEFSSSESIASSHSMPVKESNHPDEFSSSESIASSVSVKETDSLSEPLLASDAPNSFPIPAERIQLLQTKIKAIFPLSSFTDTEIAKFCWIADQEAAKPRSTETAKIEAKEHHLNRSILIGPSGKFLLLTHHRTGGDPIVGKGGFKQVKFAINLDTGELKAVAILKRSILAKKINPNNEKAKDAEVSAKWEAAKVNIPSELQIAKKFSNHKAVVHLDFWHQTPINNPEREETYYLLMDYCEGGDLWHRTEEGKPLLTASERHLWTLEITKGVTRMHREDFLHRDLKSENIFLQGNHAKLGDFGFACTIRQALEQKNTPGTPLYAAPELFKGKKASIKSDAWSLGCIVFKLLTSGGDFLAMFPEEYKDAGYIESFSNQQGINARIDLHILNPDHRRLLKRLLTLDPAQRMTVEEFYKEFKDLPVPR